MLWACSPVTATPRSEEGRAAPSCETPADVGWRQAYQRGRQAFNLGRPAAAECWLWHAAQLRPPWPEPEQPVRVDNFPEPYLPYAYLSLSLLQLPGRCADAADAAEAAVRQGVVLHHRRKHLALLRAFRKHEDCARDGGGEPARARTIEAFESWDHHHRSVPAAARQQEPYLRLAQLAQEARELLPTASAGALGAERAADLAVGAAERLEALICLLQGPDRLQFCRIDELRKGVVKIGDLASRDELGGSDPESEAGGSGIEGSDPSGATGTGFLVGFGEVLDGKPASRRFAAVLTAAHVVEDAEHKVLELATGASVTGTVDPARTRSAHDRAAKRNDFAIVQVWDELRGSRCLLLSERRPQALETVYAIGFPVSGQGELTTTEGRMVADAQDGDRLRAEIKISGGSSGGPLIDRRGQVVGLIFGEPEGFAFAVPAATLRQALQEWEIRPCRYGTYLRK